MSIRTTIFVGAALVVGSVAPAHAGEGYGQTYGYGSVKDSIVDGVPVPAPTYIPEATTWYMRGDLGYALNGDPELSVPDAFGGFSHSFSGVTLDDAFTLGGGFGRYLSQSFRVDLTADFRFASGITGDLADRHAYFDDGAGGFSLDPAAGPPIIAPHQNALGTIAGVDDGTGNFQPTHVGGRYTSELNSTVLMANLYYDLRGHTGFSPYVGGGVGLAFHRTDTGQISAIANIHNGATFGGSTETSFAAAAMAGFSYSLSRDVILDVGYRFLWLGEAEYGVAAVLHNTGNTLSVSPIAEDLYSHEFRVGLRYEVW